MNNVYVVQTNDENFKEALTFFLSKYCNDNCVNAAVHEMNTKGGEKVMEVVLEK